MILNYKIGKDYKGLFLEINLKKGIIFGKSKIDNLLEKVNRENNLQIERIIYK